MKRLLFVLLLISCASSSFAQLNVWRWQNPLPEGDFLHAVQMVSLDVIYACGENSTFMRTSDGGQTWDVQSNIFASNKNFLALSFLDRNYGMCCGDSGKVIRTNDGGATWMLLPTNTTLKLSSILVVNKNIALAIDLGGGIIRSIDGGSSWHAVPVEGSYALYSIRMLRPDFLTISGYAGIVWKSVDTGKTWVPIKTPYANTYYSARFSDDKTGTVIGDVGLILRTTDAGITWNQQTVDSGALSGSPALNVVDGKDPNVLAIVGDYGTILYTTNGGTNWKASDIGTLNHIKGLSFFDKLNAVAVGRDGVVLRSTDGGQSWFFLPQIPYTDILYSVAFPKGDTSRGLACGFYGTILRTTNGGTTWSPVPSGTGHTLRGICFMDSMSAIAVGEYGTILKSTDEGQTWTRQISGTSNHLYAVSFASPNDGFVVGDSGLALRTYSAGIFWTREFAGRVADSDFFRSVSYPDPEHAFITGQSGYYRSVDGGVSWAYTPLISFAEDPDQSSGCFGISFSDSLHGGLIYGNWTHHYFARFSSDGAVSWRDTTILSTGPFAIQCIDPLHATIVGAGGYITHSTDGKTWHDQQSNTRNNLAAVCFGSLKAGTAVGYHGNIMRITTDEKTLAVHDQCTSGLPRIIMDANYPNPFTSFTTITYHLPTSGFTSVEIFSTNGKQISTLADDFETSGEHSLRFDATGLSSGTYVIQISNGGSTVIGQMVLAH